MALCAGAILITIGVGALGRGANRASVHGRVERLAAHVGHPSRAYQAHAARRPHRRRRVAQTFAGTPTVGALFRSASTNSHSCTASVVHSSRGNVLLTAAHCISGTGAGYVFAPGFDHGDAPYGRWTVTAAYLDRAWLTRQDPHRDFAFLTVAPQLIGGQSKQIERVTGGNRIRLRLHRGDSITVPAYPAGSDNGAITCTAPIGFRGVYPAFDCDPYVGGTSGSPFLLRTARGTFVGGVIGGLHQGGCTSAVSYRPPFGQPAARAYARAAAGDAGDSAPAPGSDGC
jgi:V8-like Glu-specific endopeptidase